MPLYNPPLLIKRLKDFNSQREIKEALNGWTTDYFNTGQREGKSDNITLNVVTRLMDWQKNIFIREC